MNNWCVYKHTSPKGKVYIGITQRKPTVRWGKHGEGYKSNAHFWSAIQKYGWENFTHELIATGLTVDEAGETEKKYIAEYDSANPKNGYNIALGGQYGKRGKETSENISKRMKEWWKDPNNREKQSARSKEMWSDPDYREKHSGVNHPNYGRHLNEDARRRIAEAQTGNTPWNKGKHWDDEMKQKLSIAIKRTHPHTKWTDEHKEKQRAAMTGPNNPNYGKSMREDRKKALLEINSITIEQVKDGKVIATFASAAEAQEKTGVCSVNIRRVCNGQRQSAGGYFWRNACSRTTA